MAEKACTRAGTTKMRLHWHPTFTGMEEAVGEDVCRWAVEASTTIDGLLQVQEPSHMEEIAKLFVCADKDNAVPFRRIYLRDELCWTDAPNYLLVVMSGNIPLLKMFEEKRQGNDGRQYGILGIHLLHGSNSGARKTYYSIRRETIVGEFYIPNILTAAILSGSPEMLDYCIDHYDIDNMGLTHTEKKEALGQAIAGAGEELTEYMIEHYPGLIELAEAEQVMKAGNIPMLRHLLAEHPSI